MTDLMIMKLARHLTDSCQPITTASVYSNPLSSIQITNMLFYHAFVVFTTTGWFWSIEKNSEGLTVQRSKFMKNVTNFYRREERPNGLCRIEH